MRARTVLRSAAALTLCGLTAGVLSSCAASSAPSAQPTVQVSVTACGQGWTASSAGPQHLALHNTDSRPGEVQLISVPAGAVFADIEPLGPGTTDPVDVVLAAGHYALRCLMEDEAAVTGPTVALTGDTSGAAAGVVPVTQAQLIAPTKAYENYVGAHLPALSRDVAHLQADLSDRTRARADWLVAHLDYERLGGAYGAFGALDQAINGTHPTPNWTGFHRVEADLWRGVSTGRTAQDVATLRRDVDRLQTSWSHTQLDPLQLTIRAHEITENALEFSLSGQDDFGSHTGLATVAANLDGTTTVLSELGALVPDRDAVTAALDRAQRVVGAHRQTALDALARPDREQIDSAVSELSELLAPVASRLEPRNTQ